MYEYEANSELIGAHCTLLTPYKGYSEAVSYTHLIYAVEKSLDSYKFNLLHCKQTFISQLKSGAMLSLIHI